MDGNEIIENIKKLCKEYNVGISSQMETFFDTFKDNDAPASTQHHLAKRFGLWEHMYNVIRAGLLLNDTFNLGYDGYSIVKVGLCHDLEKFVNKAIPNVLKSGNVSEAKPYVYPKDRIFLGHGATSLDEAGKHFSLDAMEKQAILYHMYMFDYEANVKSFSNKITKFTKLIYFADDLSASLIEESAQDGGD